MRHFIVLIAIATTGCMLGGRASNYPLAKRPAGAAARVGLLERGGWVRGELLLVDDTSIVVLPSSGPAQRISLRAIGELETRPGLTLSSEPYGITLSGKTRERLRLVSRYPYGATDEVLALAGRR